MPKSKINIFICNKKLVQKYNVRKILSKEFKNKYKLITVKGQQKDRQIHVYWHKFLKKR